MTEYFSFFDAVETAPNIYDREYNAQQFTDYFKSLVTTGVMKGNGEQLEVRADGSSMNSSIGNGVAFIEGRYYYNDDEISHTHDTETLGLNRIDRIVIRMDLNTNARYVKSFIKKGAPSSNPVAPSLTQTNDIYEISLAQVKIIGGQTFTNAQDVKDERGTDIICPWAGSSILPNFDDQMLEDLVHEVENFQQDLTAIDNKIDNLDPIPKGLISMWSGSIANIPAGWVLCDGNNNTPNLKDRFIVGAGGKYTVNASGGLDEVKLNISQMPTHSHSAGSLRTSLAGSHQHTIGETLGYLAYGNDSSGAEVFKYVTGYPESKTSVDGQHDHIVSGYTSDAGTSLAHENRPPYYALAYIMKL